MSPIKPVDRSRCIHFIIRCTEGWGISVASKHNNQKGWARPTHISVPAEIPLKSGGNNQALIHILSLGLWSQLCVENDNKLKKIQRK